MTTAELSADAGAPDSGTPPTLRPKRQRPRVRMPASRGGMAWMAVVVIIGIFLAVQFGRQVYANWESGQQVVAIEAEIAAVEARNAELRRELEYLQSPAYISAEARRLADLGVPGEQVLIIPLGAEAPLPPALTAASEPEPLLDQWVQVFFGPSD